MEKIDFNKIYSAIDKVKNKKERQALHLIAATARSLADGIEHYDQAGNKLETVKDILEVLARGEKIIFKHPEGKNGNQNPVDG